MAIISKHIKENVKYNDIIEKENLYAMPKVKKSTKIKLFGLTIWKTTIDSTVKSKHIFFNQSEKSIGFSSK